MVSALKSGKSTGVRKAVRWENAIGSESDSMGEASESPSTTVPTETTEQIDACDSHEMNGVLDDSVSIICVGVMRTGLKTLHRALRQLGYSNIYDQEDILHSYDLWDDVLRNKATRQTFLDIFEGSQVVMGMPTYCFWEQLLDAYPNARVILTVRDEDEWWHSVCRAKALMDRDLPGEPLRYGSTMRGIERWLVPSYHKFCNVLRFSWATSLGAHALEGESTISEVAARSRYRQHNSHVRSTLLKRRTPAGQRQLLVYNVRDGWEPLCKFLKRETPASEYPQITEVPYFPGIVASVVDDEHQQEVDEIHELLQPDGDFGACVRRELRRSLIACVTALTLLVVAAFAINAANVVKIPVVVVSLAYLGAIILAWNVFVVMHGLVARVDALVVMPMALKSLLVAAALHTCLITYGILKEQLVTRDMVPSTLLVISARSMSVVCSSAYLYLTEGRITFGAPLRAMSAFVFTNEANTWAGYQMLNFLSFPVQVLAKSCTLLPNMIMGRVLNGTRYTLVEYVQATAALICVAIMHLCDDGHEGSGMGQPSTEEAQPFDYWNLFMGIVVIIFFFACDGFTSQWQTALYTMYPKLTQTQMMLGGNLLGLCLTLGSTVLFNPAKLDVTVIWSRPEVLSRVVVLGLVSALGQFCIYYTIRVLGPLSFTWIMTARQLFSVLISLVIFGHGVSASKLLCILTVFGIMSAQQLQEALPKDMKRCRGCAGKKKKKKTN